MKRIVFYSLFLSFVIVLFHGCIPLEISDDLIPADATRRITSWYAHVPSDNDYTFCKAVLSYNDENQLESEKKQYFLYDDGESGDVYETVTTTFTYNENGQIQKKAVKTDSTSYSMTFQYNDNDQVEKRTHSLVSTSTTFSYDDDDQLQSSTDGSGTENFTWNNDNLKKYGDYSYSYNDQNECTQMTVSSPAVKSIYQYDDNNRLSRKTFYDEVSLAFHIDFTWELGKSNFDFQNVEDSIIYQYGFYYDYGTP